MTQNEIQKASLIGRLLSMDAFLMVMGIASLVYGLINDIVINIFWGLLIIPGVVALHFVRKKDWAKHWEEMEAEHKLRADYEARRKSAREEERKAADDAKQ